MKKIIFSFSLIVFIAIKSFAQTKITVTVVANMQYKTESSKAKFNKTDKTAIDIVLSVSGKLLRQIMTVTV